MLEWHTWLSLYCHFYYPCLFNAPRQLTPLLNLHPIIFSSMSFCKLHPMTLLKSTKLTVENKGGRYCAHCSVSANVCLLFRLDSYSVICLFFLSLCKSPPVFLFCRRTAYIYTNLQMPCQHK